MAGKNILVLGGTGRNSTCWRASERAGWRRRPTAWAEYYRTHPRYMLAMAELPELGHDPVARVRASAARARAILTVAQA